MGKVKGTVTYLSKGLGSAFGIIESYVHDPIHSAEEKYKNGINRLSQTQFAENHKPKWGYLTEKAASWNQKMTGWIKPIGEKSSEWTMYIGNCWNQSDYRIVHYIRGTLIF